MTGVSAAILAAATLAVRSPDQRQILTELAYALGEAHALRQACAGPADQSWRTRMSGLMDLEGSDEVFRRRLTESFNAGFMTRHAEHPACDAGASAALRETARTGRRLAERLVGEGVEP